LDHSAASGLLDYDPFSGNLIWKVNRYCVRAGDVAGWVNSTTLHRQIRILQQTYCAHRIAWLLMTGAWPDSEIDHIDGNGVNNRWVNLRLANRSLNGANRGKNKNNTSGFKGVTWNRRSNKWRAQIWHRGKNHVLGAFDDPKAAHVAYCEAARAFFGEYARG
jgi:hypothetical protein